jgi:hypothetical protein
MHNIQNTGDNIINVSNTMNGRIERKTNKTTSSEQAEDCSIILPHIYTDMPRNSWHIIKVDVKHQSINQSIRRDNIINGSNRKNGGIKWKTNNITSSEQEVIWSYVCVQICHEIADILSKLTLNTNQSIIFNHINRRDNMINASKIWMKNRKNKIKNKNIPLLKQF